MQKVEMIEYSWIPHAKSGDDRILLNTVLQEHKHKGRSSWECSTVRLILSPIREHNWTLYLSYRFFLRLFFFSICCGIHNCMSKWYSLLFQRYFKYSRLSYCNLDFARVVTVRTTIYWYVWGILVLYTVVHLQSIHSPCFQWEMAR